MNTALNQKIVQYLTSFEEPHEVCVTGNDAIVRGALEAGVGGFSREVECVGCFERIDQGRAGLPKGGNQNVIHGFGQL